MKPTVLAELVVDELDGLLIDSSGPATHERIEAAERELRVLFPASFRAFLMHYGSGRLGWLDLFGLPSEWLWGDIVMMNELAPVKAPAPYVLIARDLRGNFYALDTSRPDDGPVIRLATDGARGEEARSFTAFLRKVIDDEV